MVQMTAWNDKAVNFSHNKARLKIMMQIKFIFYEINGWMKRKNASL